MMANGTRHGSRRRHRGGLGLARRRRDGFAILMVVLVLVGLAIIAAPFAISMRQEEHASINFAARVRARLTAIAALNAAKAQLERSHQAREQGAAELNRANPTSVPLRTIFNSPPADALGEFKVDLPGAASGVLWGVKVQDEQGKVNVKSARPALLRNLAGLVFKDYPAANAARITAIATAIETHRNGHLMTSIGELRGLNVVGGTPLTEAEFQRLADVLTVHSAPLAGEAVPGTLQLHPVNINTCRDEVLQALVLGLIPNNPVDPAYVSVTPAEAAAFVHRLRVATTLAANLPQDNPTVTVASVDGFPGTLVGTPPPAEVTGGYWLSVEGDAIKYTKRNSNGTFTVAWDNTTNPASPEAAMLPISARVDVSHLVTVDGQTRVIEVRLLLADLEHDLKGILNEMYETQAADETRELSDDSRSAILINAVNPLNDALNTDTTTEPFCFASQNVYTIEATGIVNAPDGRELARYTVREVVQVTPSGELELRVETQDDFERSIRAAESHHVAAWPNATVVDDIPPQTNEPESSSLLLRRGRLGLALYERYPQPTSRFFARFHGPLLRDVLLGDPAPKPEPFDDLSNKLKLEPGEDTDLGPDGLHIGEVTMVVGGTPTTEIRTLVYPAREDDPEEGEDENNLPHSDASVIEPVFIDFWMKPDRTFYDLKGGKLQDHFLFDCGHRTFSNRLALYYLAASTSGGELVLHVCDSTEQTLPAQVRCPIAKDGAPPANGFTLEPERWYHIVAMVKGIHYNEMALFINGRSVGTYSPVARLTAAVPDPAAGSIPCTGTGGADYDPDAPFQLQHWPVKSCANVGGEIVEYTTVDGALGILTDAEGNVVGRGSRGSQARAHEAGTRAEIHGYVDYIHKDNDEWGDGDVEHLLVNMMDSAQEPALLGTLPAGGTLTLPTGFAAVTVADGDEKNPINVPDPLKVTQSGTTQFWKGDTTYYQAATLDGVTDNDIPSSDWLPLCASTKWVVAAGADPADDNTKFAQVVNHANMKTMLTWTTQTLTPTARRLSEETGGVGLGFFRLEANTAALEEKDVEVVKYAKAGVVLVWRYDPRDTGKNAKGEDLIPDAQKRQIAWYIGYIAGFNTTNDDGDPTYAGQRACFGTKEKQIVEGATLRLNCIKLSSNQDLARGHRGTQTITHDLAGTDDKTVDEVRTRTGRGIFQVAPRDAEGNCLTGDTDFFEWIQFTLPRFPETPPMAEAEEEGNLLGNVWLYDITRAAANTGDTDHNPVQFLAGLKVMPVFFCSGHIRTMNDWMALEKGIHDEVTLTDNTGQREKHWIHHGSGNMFSFHESIAPPPAHAFAYNQAPRLVKFPSSLPIEPDKYFYLGSDTMYEDGVTTAHSHDTMAPGTEPERPANATFDDVRIYAATCGVGRLWDVKTTGGAPDSNKDARNFSSLTTALTPPFYIRVGQLEDIMPKGAPEAYRFHSNGHVDGWPIEGYAKIDDEVVYYRVIYRRPNGIDSAPIKFIRPLDEEDNPLPFPDDLVTVATKDETTLYLDLNVDQAKQFPDSGYLTISNSWANLDYWRAVQWIIDTHGATWAGIEEDLKEGKEVRDANGQDFDPDHEIGNEERVFFEKLDYANGALPIHLKFRGILNSTAQDIKMYDPSTTVYDPVEKTGWFQDTDGSVSSAKVSVISVELMILERGCLGTAPDIHAIGARVNPLENIQTTLTPCPMVRVKRGDDGLLLRDDDEDDEGNTIKKIKVFAEDDAEWSATDPKCERAIVVEHADGFPTEGYVQIGNEIIGYAQDSSDLWTAKVSETTDVTVLTGIKHLRRRYGTPRVDYLESDLEVVDPDEEEPLYYSFAADFPGGTQAHRRIVRLLEPRFHDRYPKNDDTTGAFASVGNDPRAGYYEFAYSLPGALWKSVKWTEMKWDTSSGIYTNTVPLGSSDPMDIEMHLQLDDTPAWDDTTLDPTPVPWDPLPDAVSYDPPGHRLKKPIIYKFDNPTADNYVNRPLTTALGQYADRIRLRVYFKYKTDDTDGTYNGAAPNYNIPWRTPWVDTIRIRYSGPTTVFEHREMPY